MSYTQELFRFFSLRNVVNVALNFNIVYRISEEMIIMKMNNTLGIFVYSVLTEKYCLCLEILKK